MKEGWKMKTLGEVCDIFNGSTPLRSKKEFWENGIVNWFTINDIRNQGRIINYTNQKITKEGFEKSSLRLLPSKTVLLCCTASVGEYAITNIELTTNQQFNGLVVKNSDYLLPEYLFYFSSTLKEQLLGVSGKTTIDFVSMTKVKKVKIPIPPLTEQKQIVTILDQAFKAIDQAKANIEKNIENAKELFQSKLNEIFSQKGEGWEEKSFKDVCVLQRGFDLPTRLREKGIYDLVTSSGIKDSHSEYKVLGPGVVTGRSGSIGNVFYVENNFWPLNTALYIKDFKENLEKYIYYFLRSFDLSRFASGSGVPTLNRNFVHDEKVLSIESFEEQKNIVDTLDSMEIESNELVKSYKIKLLNLEELKKSILLKAFAGELTN